MKNQAEKHKDIDRIDQEKNRYEVSWGKSAGGVEKTSFSIRKHVKERAFEKACEIREQREKERLAMG